MIGAELRFNNFISFHELSEKDNSFSTSKRENRLPLIDNFQERLLKLLTKGYHVDYEKHVAYLFDFKTTEGEMFIDNLLHNEIILNRKMEDCYTIKRLIEEDDVYVYETDLFLPRENVSALSAVYSVAESKNEVNFDKIISDLIKRHSKSTIGAARKKTVEVQENSNIKNNQGSIYKTNKFFDLKNIESKIRFEDTQSSKAHAEKVTENKEGISNDKGTDVPVNVSNNTKQVQEVSKTVKESSVGICDLAIKKTHCDDGSTIFFENDRCNWVQRPNEEYSKLNIDAGAVGYLSREGFYSEKDKNKIFALESKLTVKNSDAEMRLSDYIGSLSFIVRQGNKPLAHTDKFLYILYKGVDGNFYIKSDDYFVIDTSKKSDTGSSYIKKYLFDKIADVTKGKDMVYTGVQVLYDAVQGITSLDENYKTPFEKYVEEIVRQKHSKKRTVAQPKGKVLEKLKSVKNSNYTLKNYGDCYRLGTDACTEKELQGFRTSFVKHGYCTLNVDGVRRSFIPDMFIERAEDVVNILVKYGILSRTKVTEVDKVLNFLKEEDNNLYAVYDTPYFVVYGYEELLKKVLDEIKLTDNHMGVKFVEHR